MPPISNMPDSYLLRPCEATGPFEFTDLYIDIAWTPIAGPTVVQLLRALHVAILQAGGSVPISVTKLAGMVGVAPSRLVQAVERAQRFDLIRLSDQWDLLVPRQLHGPPGAKLRTVPMRSNHIETRFGDQPKPFD